MKFFHKKKKFVNYSNIVNDIDSKAEIQKTLDIISSTLNNTLGPYGSTTIIQDRGPTKEHTMTKDGYTVLKSIYFNNEISRTILDIIMKISGTLVRTVGDGSTSSIIIANALYKELIKLSRRRNVSPQDIITILNLYNNIFIENIKKDAVHVYDYNFKEVILKCAALSTNNDDKAGKLISKIYSEIGMFGNITLEKSDTNEDYYEISDGIEIERGYLDVKMINSYEKEMVEFSNPYILMCNGMLDEDDIEPVSKLIGYICMSLQKGFVIIAKEYSDDFKNFLHVNLSNKFKNNISTLPVAAIEIPYSTALNKDKFNDLSKLLGCRVYEKSEEKLSELIDNNEYSFTDINNIKGLGTCGIFRAFENATFIIDAPNYDSPVIKNIYDELLTELNRLNNNDHPSESDDLQVFNIKQRMFNLSKNSMARLYVGGNTQTEKSSRYFLFEDAVFACRSVIKHGFIIGCNLYIPRLIESDIDGILSRVMENAVTFNLKHIANLNKVLIEILMCIQRSFLAGYRSVLRNANIPERRKIFGENLRTDDDVFYNINDIIKHCLKYDVVYNVKTKKFENDEEANIINSAETDIEITKASLSIIGLLATSNQFVTININK